MKQCELKEKIDKSRGSLQLLFKSCSAFAGKIGTLLALVSRELALPPSARYVKAVDDKPDSVDLLNLNPEFLDHTEFDNELLAYFSGKVVDEFEFCHIRQLAGVPSLLDFYLQNLSEAALPYELPRIKRLPDNGDSVIYRMENADEFTRAASVYDCFHGARAMCGNLLPITLSGARELDDFYGFHGVRAIFEEYFSNFAAGRSVAPLFIVSLPGLGKTAMTIAHTMSHAELTLILPTPEMLESGLAALLERLAAIKHRKFVIFFDDIDPREINWYHFRTNIGGSFAMPENIACVVAANYDFAPNVLSRGRLVSFPIFDELMCMEMVSDFLIRHKLRNPDHNLISVMAADYVEEFGQKKFAELSPRSLVRYLQIYINDAKKRRKMLEFSHRELIVRPDAQLFYEQNIKLMRALYGDGYIEELLKEKLSKLGE